MAGYSVIDRKVRRFKRDGRFKKDGRIALKDRERRNIRHLVGICELEWYHGNEALSSLNARGLFGCARILLLSVNTGTGEDCCGTGKQQQSAPVPRRNTGPAFGTGILLPIPILERIVAELE